MNIFQILTKYNFILFTIIFTLLLFVVFFIGCHNNANIPTSKAVNKNNTSCHCTN